MTSFFPIPCPIKRLCSKTTFQFGVFEHKSLFTVPLRNFRREQQVGPLSTEISTQLPQIQRFTADFLVKNYFFTVWHGVFEDESLHFPNGALCDKYFI